MVHIQNSLITGTQLSPLNFRGPSATQRKRVVNFFPKQISELHWDVDLPQIRNMMSNIHPTEREARRPGAPSTTKISRFIPHNRVQDGVINDRTGQKRQQL